MVLIRRTLLQFSLSPAFLALLMMVPPAGGATLLVQGLRAEHRENPLPLGGFSQRLRPGSWHETKAIFGTAAKSPPANPCKWFTPASRWFQVSASAGRCASGTAMMRRPRGAPRRRGRWLCCRPKTGAGRGSRAAARRRLPKRRFLHPGTGRYDSVTQACQAFALYLGLVPPDEQARALDVLVRDIEETHKNHLTTGIFGTKYMLHALADAGRADVAYEIVNQKTFPGWGHMLENGATTLWEHWEFSDNTYSHNHSMFGSVSEWFYKVLAGIQPAPDAVGWDKIIIKPQPLGDLKWVKASYESVRGRITSEWEKQHGKFELRISIPIGATATVFLPAQSKNTLKESGRPMVQAAGVRLQRRESNAAVLAVQSGSYRFAAVAQ